MLVGLGYVDEAGGHSFDGGSCAKFLEMGTAASDGGAIKRVEKAGAMAAESDKESLCMDMAGVRDVVLYTEGGVS